MPEGLLLVVANYPAIWDNSIHQSHYFDNRNFDPAKKEKEPYSSKNQKASFVLIYRFVLSFRLPSLTDSISKL